MTTDNRGELVVLPTPAALTDEAARRFAELAEAAIQRNGRFTVALSGGSTPRALHQRLAQPPLSTAIDWSKVLVFWGDERFVPPDSEDSCFRMARETLLDHIPIPAANIFPVPTVGGTPESAANAYAETLVVQFDSQTPRFDLILLGMGPDGHTASLFPGHPEPSAPSDELVVAVHSAPKRPRSARYYADRSRLRGCPRKEYVRRVASWSGWWIRPRLLSYLKGSHKPNTGVRSLH